MPRRAGSHAWTGISSAITAGTESIHAEIASSQVEHWTPKQIKAAEKSGYFDSLRQRALRNTKLGLMEEISEGEME